MTNQIRYQLPVSNCSIFVQIISNYRSDHSTDVRIFTDCASIEGLSKFRRIVINIIKRVYNTPAQAILLPVSFQRRDGEFKKIKSIR